jgi:transcriptional regulator with XRE-family HTH domain
MTPLLLRIRPLREAKGWTQAGLAARAKVTQATVSNLETGVTQRLDVAVLDRIAKALGVETAALIHHPPKRRKH